MSIFNPSDYNGINSDLENTILDKISDNYLTKNGGSDTSITLTNFSNDVSINGNILASSKTISPLELSQLDGINTNQTIQQQINSIGGGGSSLLSSNNTWNGTQQFNNNIIVNSSTLTPIEISQLDGVTSNIQTQINNSNTNISTINTTLSNNGITSSTNVINSLDFLQSQINNLPNGSGSGQSYFLTSTTSTTTCSATNR
jgi:hypothetical protein